MGEVDRIHRIVQPAGVPAAANQAIRPEDRREQQKEPPGDKLELHEEEDSPVELEENSKPPAEDELTSLDIAV